MAEGSGRDDRHAADPVPMPPSDIPSFPVALLALAETPGIGHQSLSRLVDLCGDRLGRLLACPPEEAAARLAELKAPSRLTGPLAGADPRMLDKARAQMDELASRNIHVLGPERLPRRLTRLPDPDRPRWLFLQGDPEALNGTHVAVVGTREPSASGADAARAAVQTMAAYPLALVSGLANGIDAAAHDRALECGLRNVAFLGHGLDLVFPAETGSLRGRIIEQGGAVATEYPPGRRYRREQFVQRNRLQAGLAQAVVVAEGRVSGGTAHTVGFAQRYRTPVIGLRGAGISDELNRLISSLPQGRVIDVSTAPGLRALDRFLRNLAEADGHPTHALSRVERHLLQECERRELRPDDLLRLRNLLHRLLDGKP
ncbi:DNA-processing protein DprA [Nocardiopsis sp. CNT-189]|uniref:DNA-processing protein DprA n=1 Tax=Nocardiopsis oceanisediminis TaxID=2816862 RepID=UPI003B2CFF14